MSPNRKRKLKQSRNSKGDHSVQARTRTREVFRSYLIISEGENTEPSYFKFFSGYNVEVRATGTARSTVDLVNKAIGIRKAAKRYDEYWCIFDKDANQDFDEAIQLAKDNGFKVGWSNQAFEYWIYLHFYDNGGACLNRSQYGPMINSAMELLGAEYDYKKKKIITPKMFGVLMSDDQKTHTSFCQEAIERASRIAKEKGNRKPSESESMTTVYELVSKLFDFYKKSGSELR